MVVYMMVHGECIMQLEGLGMCACVCMCVCVEGEGGGWGVSGVEHQGCDGHAYTCMPCTCYC